MKAVGVVRKVDELGRFVLPKELRDIFDINIKDAIEIYVNGESIILKKYQPSCVFCSNAEETVLFKGKLICSTCSNEAKTGTE
jgi:AbrB family transcriptional regulator, transcriptional pleiotropic regulator of transition state genes